MLTKYLRAWITRAAENSVMLTDKLTILIVPFSTLVASVTGAKMTESIQETLALGVAITVAAVVVLRLGAASYWLWRDDQIEKKRLSDLFDAERSRPDRFEREAAITYTSGLRARLSDALAELLALAELMVQGRQAADMIRPDYQKRSADLTLEVRTLINALSYDVALRICAYNLAVVCARVSLNALSKKPIGDDWTKMQALRKITFRILHKRESGPDAELISMLEAQNIVEGEDPAAADSQYGPDDEWVENLKKLIRDPEIAHELRAEIDMARANHFKALERATRQATAPRRWPAGRE